MSQITGRPATGPLALQAGGLFQQSTDANLATLVGVKFDLSDGREVVLASTSSATTTTAGFLYADPALIANHQDLVVTAFTAYGTTAGVANSSSNPATVTATLGGTAATANQYQGGFLIVEEGTGIGQTLRIQGNTAQTTTTGACVITLEDAPNVALVAASSKVSLIPPHGAGVIIYPTTASNAPVGVALYAISPSSYGFFQTHGVCGVVSDSTAPAVGAAVTPSLATAGTVGALSTSASTTTGTFIGTAAILGVSAKAQAVYLNI